jgi:hypothetical protein
MEWGVDKATIDNEEPRSIISHSEKLPQKTLKHCTTHLVRHTKRLLTVLKNILSTLWMQQLQLQNVKLLQSYNTYQCELSRSHGGESFGM